jgi:hypothetical protein
MPLCAGCARALYGILQSEANGAQDKSSCFSRPAACMGANQLVCMMPCVVHRRRHRTVRLPAAELAAAGPGRAVAQCQRECANKNAMQPATYSHHTRTVRTFVCSSLCAAMSCRYLHQRFLGPPAGALLQFCVKRLLCMQRVVRMMPAQIYQRMYRSCRAWTSSTTGLMR